MNKENFLKVISNLSKEEINKMISERGKQPKKLKPIIYVGEERKEVKKK